LEGERFIWARGALTERALITPAREGRNRGVQEEVWTGHLNSTLLAEAGRSGERWGGVHREKNGKGNTKERVSEGEKAEGEVCKGKSSAFFREKMKWLKGKSKDKDTH